VIPFDELVGAALGDLDPAASDRVEEHILGCGACARTYEHILALGEGVAEVVRAGGVTILASTELLDELRRQHLITRTYRVPAGGSVQCTVAADDIFVAAEYLGADLGSATRVDLITPFGRLEDVPFDRALGRVAMLAAGDQLRELPTATGHYQLVSVEGDSQRTLADYTMHHTAFQR